MTQRQNNKSSPRIALIIPAQQVPDSGSFPTSEKAVSNWLLASASGGVDVRVSALITALKHSNRLRNTPVERLKILDIFVYELQQLLPDLRARFAEAHFPQSTSAENAFTQTALLLLEISYGYKISLVDALLKRGTLTQKVRVHTIYRAIKAIGDCGLHHVLGYRNWPARSWRDLNTLLLLAEHEKAHEIPINTGSAQNYPETIQGLYIAYTLLSASDTQRLQRHEISALFSLLCDSAGKFRLTTSNNQSSANQGFSVALNSSNAPAPDQYCNYSEHAKVRYLSLEPLMSLFSTGLNDQPGTLSHSQQRQIYQHWLQTSKRKSPRSIRNTGFFAESGLENITATLSTASNQSRYSDLFSNHWIIRNQSTGGIGLQAGLKDKRSINIGELMAYTAVQSDHGNKPWCQVGVIRWLSNEKHKPMRFGVETLAERVECVTLTTRNPHQSEGNINALMGINPSATDTQLVLMVTRKRVEAGESITLSVGPSACYRNCIISLGDKIDQRGNFDYFTVDTTPLK